MIKRLRKIFRRLSYALFILFSLFLFLAYTRPGLYIDLYIARLVLPGQLKINSVRGQLLDSFQLKGIVYKIDANQINMKQLSFSWRFDELFKRHLHINQLIIDELSIKQQTNQVKTKQVKKSSQESPPSADFSLPLTVSVDKFLINSILLNDSNVKIDRVSSQLSVKNNTLELNPLTIVAYEHQIQSTIKLNLTQQLSVDLKTTIASQNGIAAKLQLLGNRDNYRLALSATRPKLQLSANLLNVNTVSAQIRWQSLLLPSKEKIALSNGELILNGDLNKSINATFKTQAVNFSQTPISLKNLTLQTRINTNNLDIDTQLTLNYNDQKLIANLLKKQEKISAKINLGNNELSIKGTLPFFWDINLKLPQPEKLHPALKGLKTVISAKGHLTSEKSGNAIIKIAPGSYLSPDNPLGKLNFQGGSINALLNQSGLTLNGLLSIDKTKSVKLSTQLKKFNLLTLDVKNQAILAEILITLNDLSLVDNLTSVLTKTQGKFSSSIKLSGKLEAPAISGNFNLAKAKTTLPSIGLTINPINIKGQIAPSTWQLSGQLGINNQNLTVSGKGQTTPDVTAKLSINGKDVQVINNNDYKIWLSPDIKINYQAPNLQVQGQVLIPKAKITPKSFTSSVSLSDDVVFVNENTESSSLSINSNILLTLGDDVSLAFMGLTGKVHGQLKIHDSDSQATTATGNLSVTDGKYEAYGQSLTIAQADILYSGGLIDNPGLKIRAIRTFTSSTTSATSSSGYFNFDSNNLHSTDFSENTTVGIEVTGRAKSAKMTLFANPSSMSQADILSMLVLGQPAGQSSKADGQILLAAVSSLNLGGGNNGMQLMDQLKQSVGLDIGFEQQATYNQDQNQVTSTTALVLGKALSPRLYINYSLGLGADDGGVFTVKYLLNRYFNVQINAGTASNGADIFYTYPNK